MTLFFENPVQQAIWSTIRAMNNAWSCSNPDDLAQTLYSQMVAITESGHL
jgi:hypothetical protein